MVETGDIIEILNLSDYGLKYSKLKVGFRYEVIKGEVNGVPYITIYNPQEENNFGLKEISIDKGQYMIYKKKEPVKAE